MPFPAPGDCPNPGIKPASLASSALADSLPLAPPGSPPAFQVNGLRIHPLRGADSSVLWNAVGFVCVAACQSVVSTAALIDDSISLYFHSTVDGYEVVLSFCLLWIKLLYTLNSLKFLFNKHL